METGIFHLFLSQINYQQALPFKMLSCTSSSLYQIRSIKSLGIVRREEAEERGPPRRPASTPDNVSSLRWGPSASHQRSRRPSSPAWLHLSRPQPQRFLLCALLQTNVVPWHRHVTWTSLSLRDRLGPPLPSWEPPQLTTSFSFPHSRMTKPWEKQESRADLPSEAKIRGKGLGNVCEALDYGRSGSRESQRETPASSQSSAPHLSWQGQAVPPATQKLWPDRSHVRWEVCLLKFVGEVIDFGKSSLQFTNNPVE